MRVTYRSVEDLQAAIAILEGEIATGAGTTPVKRIALGLTSGLSG